MNEYKPKPTWQRCIICGEYFCFDEVVGGKVKKRRHTMRAQGVLGT